MSSRYVRISSVLFIVSGLLVAVGWSFHQLEPDFVAMQSTRWLVVHALGGIGLLIAVPALLGLYGRLGDESGRLGLAGFILATVGTTLAAGSILFIEVITLPMVASLPEAGALFNDTPPAFMALFALTFLTFTTGNIILGIVTTRSRMLPRPAGLLMVVGAPLFLAPVPPAPVIVNTIGALLFGLGFVWLGYALRANQAQTVEVEAKITPA